MSIPALDNKVLFITPQFPELVGVFQLLLENDLRPVHVERFNELALGSGEFLHVFIDAAMPGALDWLHEQVRHLDEVSPIALIQSGAREGSALAAGAACTLQLPLEAADVLLCVERNRHRLESARLAKECAVRDRQRLATVSVEGVLTTVCNELRNPLAAALANVEYLRDVDRTSNVAATPEDTRLIVDDTFEALQRVRGIVESLATLVRHDKFEARKIAFWQVTQSVLDDLGRNAAAVSLNGDPTVRGWADEDLLRQVLSTLVRRALNAFDTTIDNLQVRVRVYSTESEARISVRDNGPSLPADLLTGLLQSPDTILRQSSTEMLLAITHHAVVRMGGSLEFAQRQSQGSVFRIRLPIVRAGD